MVIFGSLLGSIVFRLTKLGTEVLQGMLDVVPLRPHIKTLTFGSATFHDSPDHPAVMKVFGLMPDPIQAKLRAAYADAAGWQVAHGGHHLSARIATGLSGLPTLKGLTLLQSDRPWELGGWLDHCDMRKMLDKLENLRSGNN